MKLQHIELKDLKPSPVNVRKHGAKDELDELVTSIRSLGVIQPLLVRPNCQGFEVIAGQRRMMACQRLEAEGEKIEPLPCAVLDSADDATAIEASLAENVARLPMDEIDQYKAFAAMKAKGASSEDIAARFGVTELLVQKRLAIANLIEPILTAYRKEQINAQTLRLLTMATKKQQRAWLTLFRDPDKRPPMGYQLKAWLFGGAEIPVSSALFPLDQYKGNVISDLFGDEKFFDDAAKFWTLQDAAIAERRAAYLESGWQAVELPDIGKGFYSLDLAKRAKKAGGRVYITRAPNGEVKFYEGFLPEKEAAKLDRAKDKADAGAQGKPEPQDAARPELTKAALRYLDLHRHNAVRNELLKAPQMALRLMLANIIAKTANWDVRCEGQSTDRNEAIAESIEASTAQKAFAAERQEVFKLLGLKNDGGYIIPPRWEAPDSCALFARLLDLSDKDVMRVAAVLMAETLAAGSDQVEALGHLLSVDMMKWWSPDDTFLDLLRDKDAINAILAEVGGTATARNHLGDTAKVQRNAIAGHLSGAKGRTKAVNWKPRYMRFPMQPYTKRGDLPATQGWKAVKKHFEKRN